MTQTSKIKVSYNDADVARSVAQRKLKAGTYMGRVIKRRGDVDKNGNMRVLATIAPVDATGNQRKPTVPLIVKLPIPTSPDILAKFGLPLVTEDGSPFQSEVPNTGWDLYRYAKATHPEFALPMPTFDDTTKTWKDGATDATFTKRADADARKVEVLKGSYDFFINIWDNASGNTDEDDKSMLGDEFCFEVSYREGNDFPNVKVLGATCPDDKVLSTEIEGEVATNG